MPLFGPQKAYRRRTFSMPCSREEALDVIAASTFGADRPFQALDQGVVSEAPLVAAVYIEDRNENGFTIAGGNRSTTHFRMRLELSEDNPTNGTFEAIDPGNGVWFGNVLDLVGGLEGAIRSTGGKTGKWPL